MGGLCVEVALAEDFAVRFGFCWRVAAMLATRSVGACVMVGECEDDRIFRDGPPAAVPLAGGTREIVTDSSVVRRVQVTVLEDASVMFISARSSCRGRNGTSWFGDGALIASSWKDKKHSTGDMADLTA